MKKKASELHKKRLIHGLDSPSIKASEIAFMVPDLEVIIYPSKKALEEAWYAEQPNFEIGSDRLWGFYDMVHAPPIRIHARSVRSHQNKDEFYHTLGHELAHILQNMEEVGQPAIDYRQASFRRMIQDGKTFCLLTWIEACEKSEGTWIEPILQRVERTLGRIYSKIRKE